jgi:hypothetical protein
MAYGAAWQENSCEGGLDMKGQALSRRCFCKKKYGGRR